MILSDIGALTWTVRIVSFALVLQTIEFLMLKESYGEKWIWDWEIIRRDYELFPKAIRLFLDLFLRNPNFTYLLFFRLTCSFALFLAPFPIPLGFVVFLFLTTILISLRWRGTFNGGSDFMNLIVLAALSVAAAFPSSMKVRVGCLWYISLQACTSYFVAGFSKLKTKNWRTGEALKGFFSSGIYEMSFGLHQVSKRKWLLIISSWALILFECTFPLALLNPQVCLILLVFGLCFHLGAFYAFGLNRFVFAWLATYPALFYCSGLGAGSFAN